MKKEKLIEELQKLPEGTEVCILDWRKNLFNDAGLGDGSHEGIYPDFDVEAPEEGKNFASLGFNNDDYDSEGEVNQESEIFEFIVNESRKMNEDLTTI